MDHQKLWIRWRRINAAPVRCICRLCIVVSSPQVFLLLADNLITTTVVLATHRTSADHGVAWSFRYQRSANLASKAWRPHLNFVIFVVVCISWRSGSSTSSSVPWAIVMLWWWRSRSSASTYVLRTIVTVWWFFGIQGSRFLGSSFVSRTDVMVWCIVSALQFVAY
jgi:hypothetical protein